jgi:iron complex transport system substrate-binding protein
MGRDRTPDGRDRLVDRGRRLAAGASVALPLMAAAALARGARSVLVGTRGFTDSGADPGRFPKPLRGPTGEVRTLPQPPQRIVSTYLGAEETLVSLVAPERVRAVSIYADDPATSNCRGHYPAEVPRLRTDPETIVSLEPDLVCVAGFTESDVLRLLVGAGLPVVRWSRFDSFADIMGQTRLLGAAVGEEARAAEEIAAIERLLADLSVRLANVRPTRVLYYDPPTYTMGRGTLVGEILTRAGGANVVEELGIVGPGQVSIETILALEPEAIVMPRYADNVAALGALGATAAWREVPAVKAGKVHEIPGAWIATVSHYAARGLERVARLLHPERF